MRKLVFLTAIAASLVISSCSSSKKVVDPYSSDDISYMVITSRGLYVGKTVSVDMKDSDTQYEVKVVRNTKTEIPDATVGVAAGKRRVIIKDGDKVLYDKKYRFRNNKTTNIKLK